MQKKGAALAQLRADGKSPVQVRVPQHLKDRGGQLNSRVLALIFVRAESDPLNMDEEDDSGPHRETRGGGRS